MFENIRSVKGIGILLIALVLGVVLFLLGSNTEKEKGKGSAVGSESVDALERRLEELLSELYGVSEVEVMINASAVSNESQSVFAPSGAEGADGLGVNGVAVICRGGEKAINQKNIIDIVCTLFDIPYSKVCVCGR